jgi:hypothetical protein
MTQQEFENELAKDEVKTAEIVSKLRSIYPSIRVGHIIQNALNAIGWEATAVLNGNYIELKARFRLKD